MDLGIISFTIYNVKRETCAMFIFLVESGLSALLCDMESHTP